MSEQILVKSNSTKLIIKKSEFLSFCFPVYTKDQIKKKIELIRKDNAHASHVVHGAVYGLGNSKSHSMSDDGEPKGTAGKPILELLQRNSITNCLLVVVRYFGGIKLGAGGLLRAYLDSAKLCLDQSVFEPYREMVRISFNIPYSLHGKIKTLIASMNGENNIENFGEQIQISLSLEKKYLHDFESSIKEISHGSINIEVSKSLSNFH